MVSFEYFLRFLLRRAMWHTPCGHTRGCVCIYTCYTHILLKFATQKRLHRKSGALHRWLPLCVNWSKTNFKTAVQRSIARHACQKSFNEQFSFGRQTSLIISTSKRQVYRCTWLIVLQTRRDCMTSGWQKATPISVGVVDG